MEQEEAVDSPGSESDEDNEKQSKSNAKTKQNSPRYTERILKDNLSVLLQIYVQEKL